MDYSTYKNSIMIPDQSAWQHVGFTLSQPNPINVFGFLEKQQITVYAPTEAKGELGYQIYQPNLFSGIHNDDDSSTVAGEGNLNTNYVLSQINGSLTPKNVQPIGFEINLVESNAIDSSTLRGQLSLWDATSVMQKMARNKRSQVDYTNIILARSFQKEGKNTFVFVNDQKQIKQLNFEGIKYLRPDKLFAWMCKDNFIDPRKGAWNFKKRQSHNRRWTKPRTKFKNNLC